MALHPIWLSNRVFKSFDEAADNYLDAHPIAAALKSIHKKAGQR